MDTQRLIERAQAERARLIDRMQRLDSELSNLRQEVAKIDAFFEVTKRLADGDGVVDVPTPVPVQAMTAPHWSGLGDASQPITADVTQIGRMTIADACEAIIRAAGRRVRTIEFVTLLRQAGKFKSHNPRGNYNTVAQTMKREPGRFVRPGLGEWTLVELGDGAAA